MAFDGDVAGLPARIYYQFVAGELQTGMYEFHAKHTNPDAYVEDFSKVKQLVKDKYGDPEIEKDAWQSGSELFREHPGLALELGYVTYGAIWKTGSSDIVIMCES